ncbi:ankyrin repeat domain-containing protein [Frankia sp. AgB1.9]|uniref:ankyrin repeat domain-containing protein n=1 Tax=unclassified Frankia TaxID=2632575 RepID=UPI001931943A|nr:MULTISPECIES: ankyrin repeat domain-containing protein [unclassified Frankia]MBL7490798.1 ankyrin repeat domain-containing protein [Frankia sp. AgW1.1]MBL7552245.1 ankyrin repeat domain-containing protein [Frankia sp. AgB1.9]MBL7621996.1 ankyrin repeat domain-containing protein [Frankia sp. AgB1.8]
MASRPLPVTPNLDQLRRQAKELRDAARAGDRVAWERIAARVDVRSQAPVSLSVAQVVLAREYGFASWPRLKAEAEAKALDRVGRVEAFLTASVTVRDGLAERLLAGDPTIVGFDAATAAVVGDAATLGRLIAADPAAVSRPVGGQGWPPLLYVCHSRWHRIDPDRADGLLAAARLLLTAGADPNTAVRRGGGGLTTALYGAVGVADNPAVTRLLLEAGADPDDGESAYHAVFHPDTACLRLLVEFGLGAGDATRALPGALGRDNREAVRLLLAAGADPGRAHPNEPAPTGLLPDRTLNPLPAAAGSDSPAVIEALLAAGADPNAVGRDGLSARRIAVRRGRDDVAAVLACYGAADDATPVDRLLGACRRGDGQEARRLLADHPDLRRQLSRDDHAGLVDAAEYAGAGPVALMLDLGFPVGVHRPEDGATALHAASYTGRLDAVRLLLDHGADIDAADQQWGATPLAWATVGSGERPAYSPDGDWAATVSLLLTAGATRDGAWVGGKPPTDEVAVLLAGYGIGEPDDDASSTPAEPPAKAAPPTPAARRISEQLRTAFDTSDNQALADVLHPDVRWGGGPTGCHSRAHVLEWYQLLRAQGVSATVETMTIHGDTITLGLAVTHAGQTERPADPANLFYQAFTVADDAVVEIRDANEHHP